MTFKETGFRAFYHQICALELNDKLRKRLKNCPEIDKASHVAVYGYIDPEKGLMLEVLGAGKQATKYFYFKDPYEGRRITISISDVADVPFLWFEKIEAEGIESRALEMFLAAILRNDLMNACKETGLELPRLIEELDSKLFLVQMSDGTYTLINKVTQKMQRLLDYYGVTTEDLQTITGDVTERERSHGKGVSQYHDLPSEIRERNKNRKRKQSAGNIEEADPTEPVKTTDAMMPHQGPGRPPGRKNNKTLQREAAELAAGKQPPVHRRPGRPPGRKNNKTIEREAKELASGNAPQPKRKPGRPPGARDSKPRKRRTRAEMEQLRRGQK